MRRVLVAGGGLAGCAAAVAARLAGAEVTLAWRAPGASALHSGAFAFDPDLAALPAAHPLRRLELDPLQLGSALDAAVDALLTGLRMAGLELAGSWRSAAAYADLHGRPRTAALVPAAAAGGELGSLRTRRVAVVGFDRVSDYDAETTAETMRELAGVDAFAHPVEAADLPVGASLTDLVGRAAPPLAGVRAEAIAFPPGLAGLPDRGFELLATTPSPFGWRLHQALHAWVGAAGAHLRRLEIDGFAGDQEHLEAALAGTERLEADAFVLATGRFIGGGLRKERRVDEPLLGLEAAFAGAPAHGNPRLPHLEYLDPDPAFLTGVATDRRLRPGGFQNLYAAGALLAGWDEAGPGGSGVPLLTGWLAGGFAAAGRGR